VHITTMLDEDTSSIVIGADNNQVSINIKQLKTVSDLILKENSQ
jgi:hypothetical protein